MRLSNGLPITRLHTALWPTTLKTTQSQLNNKNHSQINKEKFTVSKYQVLTLDVIK